MSLINLRTNLKDLKFGHDQYKGASSNEPYVVVNVPANEEPLQTKYQLFSGKDKAPALAKIGLSAVAGALIGRLGGSLLGNAGLGTAIGAGVGLGIGILGVNTVGDDIDVDFKNKAAGTGGPDFLVRGGTLLPSAIINDELRLAKFFTDIKGDLFVIKQNILSRLSVRSQASTGLLNDGIYTNLSTLAGAAGNAFGLHVNKQGANPFLGLGETYTPNNYFTAIKNQIVEANNTGVSYTFPNNRLIALSTAKFQPVNGSTGNTGPAGSNFDLGFTKRIYKDNNIPLLSDGGFTTLLRYSGGPGADLGIGKTSINYATDNEGAPLSAININNLPTSTQDFTEISETSDETHIYNSLHTDTVVVDFRQRLKIQLGFFPNYDTKNIEFIANLGDPGNPNGKNLQSYTSGSGTVGVQTTWTPAKLNKKGKVITPAQTTAIGPKYSKDYGAASVNSYDKINASLADPVNNTNTSVQDLVEFKIGVISNNNPSSVTDYYFRAFLNTITDNYTGNWDSIKYIGRGENFYTYSGFDRKISLSWTVAAQSKAELMPMYYRLNNLASMTSPDYSSQGYMRGNITKLTIGDYIKNQYGIITSISYTMNEESDTWEIQLSDDGTRDDSVRVLPHIIRVQMEFTPIHNFVPSLNENYISATNWFKNHFIAQ